MQNVSPRLVKGYYFKPEFFRHIKVYSKGFVGIVVD